MKTIFYLLVIAVAYFSAGLALCQSRATSKDPTYLRSDFLVFILPFILSAISNVYALWTSGMFKKRPAPRLALLIVGSIAASFVVFFFYMATALNIYGS
jgi:hypothetical protein